MYKKREIRIAILFILFVGVFILVLFYPMNSKEESFLEQETNIIQIKIEGEVVRNVEIICYQPISYGAVFLKIYHCLNEYSDLSKFKLEELIFSSKTIFIPTLDLNNQYIDEKVYINEAVFEKLVKLPQIGEKRAQKIIEYINTYGYIENWEKLWEVTNVPKEVREQIMEQAIL